MWCGPCLLSWVLNASGWRTATARRSLVKRCKRVLEERCPALYKSAGPLLHLFYVRCLPLRLRGAVRGRRALRGRAREGARAPPRWSVSIDARARRRDGRRRRRLEAGGQPAERRARHVVAEADAADGLMGVAVLRHEPSPRRTSGRPRQSRPDCRPGVSCTRPPRPRRATGRAGATARRSSNTQPLQPFVEEEVGS